MYRMSLHHVYYFSALLHLHHSFSKKLFLPKTPYFHGVNICIHLQHCTSLSSFFLLLNCRRDLGTKYQSQNEWKYLEGRRGSKFKAEFGRMKGSQSQYDGKQERKAQRHDDIFIGIKVILSFHLIRNKWKEDETICDIQCVSPCDLIYLHHIWQRVRERQKNERTDQNELEGMEEKGSFRWRGEGEYNLRERITIRFTLPCDFHSSSLLHRRQEVYERTNSCSNNSELQVIHPHTYVYAYMCTSYSYRTIALIGNWTRTNNTTNINNELRNRMTRNSLIHWFCYHQRRRHLTWRIRHAQS